MLTDGCAGRSRECRVFPIGSAERVSAGASGRSFGIRIFAVANRLRVLVEDCGLGGMALDLILQHHVAFVHHEPGSPRRFLIPPQFFHGLSPAHDAFFLEVGDEFCA